MHLTLKLVHAGEYVDQVPYNFLYSEPERFFCVNRKNLGLDSFLLREQARAKRCIFQEWFVVVML
jgi:hypothetical protein